MNALSIRLGFTAFSALLLVSASADLASANMSTLRRLQYQASQTRDNGGTLRFEDYGLKGMSTVETPLVAGLVTDSPILEPNQPSRIQELVQQARRTGSVRN